MTEEEVELQFFESGVEHWIEKIKQTLELSELTALSFVSEHKIQEVLNLVDSEIEKRALERVFQAVTARKKEENVHVAEYENWWSTLDSRQNDKVLVSAIKSKISEEDKEVFQATDPTQFEHFLKRSTHPNVNRVLRSVFTDIKKAFKHITLKKIHKMFLSFFGGDKQPLQRGHFLVATPKATKEEVVLAKLVPIQSLRQEIQAWFKMYADINRQNVHTCVGDLLKLKVKYEEQPDLWKTNVLYLRETQKTITSIVGILLSSTDSNIKEKISASLRKILGSNVERSYFPNIGYITKILSRGERNPFIISNIQDLTELLQNEISKSRSETTLQSRLEAAIKVLSNKPRTSYENLVCVGVLQVFSFNTESFLFENDLQLNDFKVICEMLKKHLTSFEALKEKEQKQAYVSNLALFSASNRAVAVQYALQNMPESLCAGIRSSYGSLSQRADFENFKSAINKLLPDGYADDDLTTLALSIRSLFYEKRENVKP